MDKTADKSGGLTNFGTNAIKKMQNITGFFTKFGDGGADILPLFRLNKRQRALFVVNNVLFCAKCD